MLAKLAGDALVEYVPREVAYLRSDELEATLFPAGLLLRGREETTARAHGVVVEALANSDAFQTTTPEAQEIERKIRRVWSVLERHVAHVESRVLASRLDAVPSVEGGEMVDLLALAAEEAARYDVEVTGESISLRGDARLLRRMIRNLLENAQRHGAPPVTLTLKGRELSVCDAGSGVPEGDRERIFQPFYRGARGSGLGLSIVRTLVTTELNGRISMRPATVDDLMTAGLENSRGGADHGTVVELVVPLAE